jgi:hypothetical protein
VVKRLSLGNKIRMPVRSWNEMAATSEAAAAEQAARLSRPLGEAPPPVIVDVRNNAASTLPPGSILGLGAPFREPASDALGFREANGFEGAVPVADDHRYQFVILERSLVPNEVGPGLLVGRAWVQVNVLKEIHPFATPADGGTAALESSFWGCCRILWSPGGTGLKTCYVEHGPFTYAIWRGKTDSTHANNTQGTISVFEGVGVAGTDSLADIEQVYNPYATVAANQFVDVGWVNDGPEILAGGADRLVRFQLTADLSTGGSAAAVIRVWDGAAYANGAAITVFDWWSISGGGRGMLQGVTGMEGYALLSETDSAQADVIWMEQFAFALEFTLTENMGATTANQAAATVTASWEQGVDPGSTITVHDDQGRFPDAINGCKGLAIRSEYAAPTSPATPYYKIVSCQRSIREAKATLSAPMCGDTPAITGWTPIPLGEHAVDPGAGTLNNTAEHRAKSGDTIWFQRSNNAPPFTWEAQHVTLHAIAIVTDQRVKADKSAIESLKVTAALEICADPAWEDEMALIAQRAVTDVNDNTTTLDQALITLYVLATDTLAGEQITTISDCSA